MDRVNEFVISVDKGQLIRNFSNQIENLFNVHIEFTSDRNTAARTGNEWIKISGNETDRKKAEDYTKGISNPETRVYFVIPEFLRNQNSWNRDEVIWQVQRDSCALVQNENISKLYIQGSEMSVATAISLLENRVNLLTHAQNHSIAQMQQSGRYYNQAMMSPYATNDYRTNSDIVAKGSSIISHQRQASTLPRGASASPSNYDNLKDFATKLGYSTEEVNIAISKCTSVINENALLQQLVTLFPPRYSCELPVSSDSSKLTRDSSSDYDKKNSSSQEIQKTTDNNQKKNDATSENKLRHIVVDGSNVAMSHGNKEVFSCKGIMICVDYFKKRGHTEITVFVPQWRKEASKPDRPIVDQQILLELEKERVLAFTPSRRVNGRRVVCYDDRYIVRFAAENDGIIVSNDNFRDLEKENPEWKKVIEERLLMYTFVKDCFMPPDDPLGRHGPKLNEFLKKGTVVQPRLCPYRKKCTYGQKCKFYHPERIEKSPVSSPKNGQVDIVKTDANRNNQNLDCPTSLVLLKACSNKAESSAANFNIHQTGQNAEQIQKNKQIPHQNAVGFGSCSNGNNIAQWNKVCGQEKKQQDIPKVAASSSNKQSIETMQALQSLFPNHKEAVRKIMAENPHETDANKLADLLLRNLDTNCSQS